MLPGRRLVVAAVPLLLSVALLSAGGCSDTVDDRFDDAGRGDGGIDSGSDARPDTSADTGPDVQVDAGPGDAGDDGQGPDLQTTWPDCDPMVPTFCGFPFPSNIYLVDDASTPTGKRLAMPVAMMPRTGRTSADPAPFNLADGFSAAAAPMTHLPGATTTGLATPQSIPDSLGADSPTVMIDAETGERIAHWAELDVSPAALAMPERTAFLIRPVGRLKNATRYVVAIRNVKDADGNALPANEIFAALRDGTDHPDPSVAARRTLYDDLFARLDKAGIARNDLQIAWDYSTASTEDITGAMLAVRDAGLAALPPGGPAFRVTSAVDRPDVNDPVARIIEGVVTVPLYLDSMLPGGRLALSPKTGLPVQKGTAEFPFKVVIPKSAIGNPAPLLQVGHGLFGTRDQVEGYAAFANQYHWVMFALDWIGMSSSDPVQLVSQLTQGRLENFQTIPDRLHQAMLNFIVAMRLMSGPLASHKSAMINGQSTFDTSQRFYFGGSQGGILGSVYMAVTPDILRGGLGVPGQPYNLLLNRSVDFDEYFEILNDTYGDPLTLQLLLGLIQGMWDRAEPAGYSHHIQNDPLPGTPAKRVLLQVAIGDHQVTTLGAHVMARAIGAKHLRPVNRTLYGLEEVDGPYQGSAMIEYDFGITEPITNVPTREGDDPHGRLADVVSAGDALDHFLRTGEVMNFCGASPCSGPLPE